MAMNPVGKTPSNLAEINVTPLVDVMLVLLIIFMITSSVETTMAKMEKQRILKREKEQLNKGEDLNQKVPINLPNVNSEAVNLHEEKKIVLSINKDYEMFIGTTKILSCFKKKSHKKKHFDKYFNKCLDALEKKIKHNEKLMKDNELYLRADESLPYGKVLKIMARIRKAGIVKFGLIAEPE